MTQSKLLELARYAAQVAKKAGAGDARVHASRSREVRVEWRDGKLDRIRENTQQSLSISLYVDGRYSGNSTSDIRREAVAGFIEDSVAMTRYLEPDVHRHLPDPSRYQGMTTADLQLRDSAVLEIQPEQRLATARQLEQAVRDSNTGGAKINSVETSVSDNTSHVACVTTNGFEGEERHTSTWRVAEASIDDKGDRKPVGWDYGGGRFVADLPSIEQLGKGALERALAQLGSKQVPTGEYAVVIENRAAPTFARHLFRAMSGGMVQQKRSFLEGKLGQRIAAKRLTVTSDPHVPRGLGSTAFDGEGMVTSQRPVIEKGVLKNYFLDTYYASKLEMDPTSGSRGNLVWSTGERDAAQMVARLKRGIYVTRFLGGNSNSATGDFSLGVKGFYVVKGGIVHPVSEVNIAGNQIEFWKQLAEIGNDPWKYSTNLTPTLRFDDVQCSGAK
jgi:PmbA protein